MRTTTALLSLLALAACDAPETLDAPVAGAAVEEGVEAPDDLGPETHDLLDADFVLEPSTEPGGADLVVHARIGTADNAYVEFFSSSEDPEDVGIGVMATFPDAPLVAADFVKGHDPVEVFLAVAPMDFEVPEGLLELRPDVDTSPRARRALKVESLAALAELPDFSLVPIAAGCSTVESWMNGWYDEDNSCANGVNQNKTWYDWELICAYGDSSCDYVLDNVARGFCNGELDSGHLVDGRTTKVAGRWQKKGDITWGSYGYRSHQAVSNCPTSNGDLEFHRERAGSSYLKMVPKNSGYHYFYGYNTPRPLTYWPNGGWKKDYTNDKWNGVKVRMNSGTNDNAIMCADVYQRYKTYDASYSGSDDLCISSDCDNACTNN